MTKNDRIIKRDRRAEEDRMTKKTEWQKTEEQKEIYYVYMILL